MVLHNIYALRMNVDLGFKQIMMKRLNQALQDKINKESFKKLFLAIFDELHRPPERFFDIFDDDSNTKFEISLETIREYREQLYNIKNLKEHHTKVEKNDIEFLQELLKNTEIDSSLYRAIEDYIIEFESGIFNSRYYKKGEVRRFLLYHINKYIIMLLERRYENMAPIFSFNFPLLRLIPEFYLNLIKISELIYEALDDLFELPNNLYISSFSMLNIHVMSILMTLIFEEYSFNEKLSILNNFYEYKIKSEDISSIAKNFNRYKSITLSLEEIQPHTKEFKLDGSKFYLYNLGREMFTLGLYEFSMIIDEYLYQNEENEEYKTLFLDNIATAHRDLGDFDKAIEVYEEANKYYLDKKLHYRYFLAKKNMAYCYFQLGNLEKSSQIFDEIEGNFSIYSEEELNSVYYNLAFRYRLIFQFEKEEYYLNLALLKMHIDDQRYLEIHNRTLEIEEYFDSSIGKLDYKGLKKLELERYYENKMRRAYTYLNNYNLTLGKFFLEQAYKHKDLDGEYWRFISNIYTLKEEWDKLNETGEEIMKINSHDFFGYFYKCLYYIHKKDNENILSNLLKIKATADSFIYSNPLTYERMSNILYFICRSYSKKEVKEFINFVFSEFEKNKDQNYSIVQLLLFFAVIFSYSNEKPLSGHIYKKYMDIEKSKEVIMLYAGWCYRFNDFVNSRYFYKKALSFSPNNIEILERLSRVSLLINEFGDSLNYIDKILNLIRPEYKEPYEKLKNHIILLRDEKIRFEKVPFKDVKTAFNTAEYQLKILDPSKDIEFGIILTQLSKAIELLLAKTLGLKIYEFIKKNHFPISDILRKGNNRDIKSINILLLNFLDDPSTHIPTLGNWMYILKGILEKFDPQNPIMQDIFDFLSQPSVFKEESLKTILDTIDVLLEERNFATHKKLYQKEEIEVILRKLVPIVNELIELIL